MNVSAVIAELSKRLGPPKERAAFGSLTKYAWLVRGLVEQGHGVTEAVRFVLKQSGANQSERAFRSTRAAYYKIRKAPWPAELANQDSGEGFE